MYLFFFSFLVCDGSTVPLKLRAYIFPESVILEKHILLLPTASFEISFLFKAVRILHEYGGHFSRKNDLHGQRVY